MFTLIKNSPQLLGMTLVVLVTGCTDLKTPAAANVAVANAAVDEAFKSGGAEHAAAELQSARDRLTQARVALSVGDFKKANTMASQALADARLAQSKVQTAKAEATTATLLNDIVLLQEQIRRASQKSDLPSSDN